ncbi:MAG: hypothetical protein HW410_1900 [Nitrosarchaeum sp.]|nr:hypothetical protein [Nitrosarchaeum sp.]
MKIKDVDRYLNDKHLFHEHFPNIKSLGRIVYTSTERDKNIMVPEGVDYRIPRFKSTKEVRYVRYFITSKSYDTTKEYLSLIRKQWAIESKLHYVLDVGFNEDSNKTRNMITAQNLATARKIAYNIVSQDKTVKAGFKVRMRKAGWDTDYLELLLNRSYL